MKIKLTDTDITLLDQHIKRGGYVKDWLKRKGSAAKERKYICFYLIILTASGCLIGKKIDHIKANYTELYRQTEENRLRIKELERRM